jgi:hypothetical protein
MGWWGYGITEGDSPYDVIDAWEEQFGKSRVTSEDALMFINEQHRRWGNYDSEIVVQTVGFIMVEAGMPISDELRQKILDACDADQSDRWNSVDERKAAIAQFRKAVAEYDGTPIEIRQYGLFEKINEALSKGGPTGLINTNVPKL